MRRRSLPIGVVIVVMSVGVGALVATLTNDGTAASPDTSADEASTSTDTATPNLAEATRLDLRETFAADGVLTFGDHVGVVTNSTGIVSGLPEDGDVPEFGTPLFFVDGEPVFVFKGSQPQYRDVRSGMKRGSDVLQLEYALRATSWVDNSELDPNDKVGQATWDALERLYEYFDLDGPDELPVGSLLFVPVAFRVGSVHVVNGQRLTGSETIFDRTDVTPIVDVDVDPSRLELFPVGGTADVTLPTGEELTATVRSQNSTVQGSFGAVDGADPDVTIGVELVFDDAVFNDAAFDDVVLDLPEFAPVEVTVTRELHESVMAVPIVALVALDGGGFGVERWDGTTRSLVAVDVGDSADGLIEITAGQLSVGDQVVVP